MNTKLLKLAGGSVLSAMLLAGCGIGDEEPIEDPAVEEDMQGEENEQDTMIEENNQDTMIEENDGSEDINKEDDMDPATDQNTPEEDVIEDEKDMEDADNKDS